MTSKILITVTLSIFIAACSSLVPKAPPPSTGHLKVDSTPQGQIPEVVQQAPFVPPPEPQPQTETYTVVVNEVPVKELLFALARDAKVNVDIDPSINGIVTINAVDQSLPQILDRISRQVDMRYEFQGDVLTVMPDTPYLRTYKVDYINMARENQGSVKVATQIESAVGEGGSTGSNNSTTDLKGVSNNRFWRTLVGNIAAIIGESSGQGQGQNQGLTSTNNVIPNAEAGVISVRATSKQHEQVQAFIDRVVRNARRQVLIEATIVEVDLSDQYRVGIDWSIIANSITGIGVAATGFTAAIPGLTGAAAANSLLGLTYQNAGDAKTPMTPGRKISATLNLLQQFGDVKVLSSPKLMVLNNQSAVLKVAENIVYFTVKSDTNQNQNNSLTTVTTTPHTVPVGFVMSLTPQINDRDEVILDVRPTISRVTTSVPDPNPSLNITSSIPQIAVKEMESILNLQDGQIAVLGGLMQDQLRSNKNEVPLLSRLPGVGDSVFTSNATNNVKSELVIFLRPVIVRQPSLDADLAAYRPYLERNTGSSMGSVKTNTP